MYCAHVPDSLRQKERGTVLSNIINIKQRIVSNTSRSSFESSYTCHANSQITSPSSAAGIQIAISISHLTKLPASAPQAGIWRNLNTRPGSFIGWANSLTTTVTHASNTRQGQPPRTLSIAFAVCRLQYLLARRTRKAITSTMMLVAQLMPWLLPLHGPSIRQ